MGDSLSYEDDLNWMENGRCKVIHMIMRKRTVVVNGITARINNYGCEDIVQEIWEIFGTMQRMRPT